MVNGKMLLSYMHALSSERGEGNVVERRARVSMGVVYGTVGY
jgi:hypothetical protein